MRRVKISVLILVASLLLFAVCAFLLATRPTLMPTGVPGDSVEFGMTVDEVRQAAGSPDWAYQDAFWHRDCIYYYYERELLGHTVSMSYQFNDMEENPRARVTEVSATYKFDTSEECNKAMEKLCAHFREIMKEEPQFHESTQLGPAHDWDPPDILQTYTISSAQRRVRIIQYSNHFFLSVERKTRWTR